MSSLPQHATTVDLATSKFSLWARSALIGSHSSFARDLCKNKDAIPKAKIMRQLFASIGQGKISAAEAVVCRSAHLASARIALLSGEQSAHRSKLQQSFASMDNRASLAMAEMGALAPMSHAASSVAMGSLLAAQSGPDCMRATIARRERNDWATEIRRAHGGALFSDPMLLAMLRIVPLSQMQEALDATLAFSILCSCPQSASAALHMGACPHKVFDIEALGLWPGLHVKNKSTPLPKTHSLVGLALHLSSVSRISFKPAHSFETNDDAPQLGALRVALGCCRATEVSDWLSFVHAGLSTPANDAMGLALSRGLVRCARHLLTLGMDPMAPSCGRVVRPDSPQFLAPGAHPLRIKAIADIYAEGAALALSKDLAASLACAPSGRPASRL
jgi:hypothetical protein